MAGHLITTHLGTTARLVSGVTVALIVLMPAVAWQGLFRWHSTDSRATLDRIGRSVVDVTSNGRVTSGQMASFLHRPPDAEAVVLTPPSADRVGSLSLRGECVEVREERE